MELVTFIADSATDAATQVRQRLGATAVVVHVRPLPAQPRRWFGRPRTRFEVLAYRPEPGTGALDATSDAPARPDSPAEPALALALEESPGEAGQAESPAADPPAAGRAGGGTWRTGALLESAGFLPANAQRVVDELRRVHGEAPPEALTAELRLVRGALTKLWRGPAPRIAAGPPVHLLVGAPGVGKTTCLCKWLTQLVLQEGRPARVWRLDGSIANTAESLGVYCDVLGVPLERSWPANGDADDEPETVRFVDLPGVDWRNPAAIRGLAGDLRRFPRAQVHLVLNGAYETSLLLRQVRAFAGLPVNDLIVTHLDEEARWGRVWNLVLGTNYSVRFLSAGQNVPGEFFAATAEAILQRQFPA